ncbi:hypothetical protein H5410_056419 [Solanum commersonii]|uniref:Uncharacterized protein n=1 Tax=Solanum commersonii TaxID=4109 RepID=A0A9J5WLN3_SOLCO|nr:hypothetical protein H5410_056419 [Solanum commersonii]
MQQETKAIETSRKVIPSMANSHILVSTISDETCYKVGDNMMYYSTGNKTTTLININDVPHNALMSKAQQVLGDNRDIKVSISRKEYNYQQASKYCSS